MEMKAYDKKTGDINTFLEFIETKNIEENIDLEEQNGDNKDESYYIKRK